MTTSEKPDVHDDLNSEFDKELLKTEISSSYNSRLLISKDLDNYLFLLNTGGILASFTIIKDIVKSPNHPILLIGSWVIFIIGIISMLLSYAFTLQVYTKKISIGIILDEVNRKVFQKITKHAKACTTISAISLVIGMILLVSFVIINFSDNGSTNLEVALIINSSKVSKVDSTSPRITDGAIAVILYEGERQSLIQINQQLYWIPNEHYSHLK